jgi:hypothetical protein
MLEYINGWRRQTGKWSMDIALFWLDEIKSRIDFLGDHPRKNRLTELWLYHSGLIHHLNGNFFEAAACHDAAAYLARGNSCRVQLSFYSAAYESLNNAIQQHKVHNISEENVAGRYFDFQVAAGNFFSSLGYSDNDVRWRNNVLCHQVLYAWLAKGEYPQEEDIVFLDELPDDLRSAFADATVVLSALAAFSGNPMEAEQIARRTSLTAEIDWYSFAQLLRFLAFVEIDATTEALGVLSEFRDFLVGRHGGHLALVMMN